MKELPQVVPETGISQDYKNVLNAARSCVDAGLVKKAAYLISKYGVPTYEEYFNPAEYSNVVNGGNRKRVEGLDRIAKTVRTFTDPANFPVDEFKMLMEEFDAAIYSKHYKPRS